MSDPSVLFALEGQVGVLRLNRPDQLNALTPEMLDRIAATLRRAVDEGARAVLVTGEGRAFCSGADLAANSAGGAPRDLGETLRAHYNPMAEAFASLPIPIVTAVNGPAAGAGASIALLGDIVVAARSAYLLLAFSNIGLVPDAGVTWLVAKSAGRAKALEMALLGERMSAEEAQASGLVARVVDDAELMPSAMDLAAKLAAKPTMALGLIRKQVAAALNASLTEVLALEAVHQGKAGQSEDFREGVTAFLQKRPAEFKGR
ncbi:enoyl-CoA hydratase-related protein [Sphingomonas sp.]|uniref:enoyl-CoA hydratase-related protein n=1 Tax=Sphingomonas sp. TaxID=28214 RepID=UPI001B2146F4|nr:enoyl-CoA hydratase-related protein [Sphingomonas sp.]MBO9711458.1 enoyl-CoA hydratase/isomerase family protein [Sphingomonas sp.]